MSVPIILEVYIKSLLESFILLGEELMFLLHMDTKSISMANRIAVSTSRVLLVVKW